MTVQRDPDAILATWLEEGPTRLPDATRRAIAVSTATTHQARRPIWSSWRYPFMNTYAKLAITAVVVVAVGAAGLALLGTGMSGLGGQLGPSPSPSPAAQASLSAAPTAPPSLPATGDWLGYTSSRYGYTMGYPSTWTVTAADRDWKLAVHPDWSSSAADRFVDTTTGYPILVTAFADDLPAGMALDAWMSAYYAPSMVDGVHCSDSNVIRTITIDGRDGKFVSNDRCADSEAFVLVDGRVHVFSVWREQQSALLEAFLSTVRFPIAPASASPAPAASLPAGWTPFHSNQYGYDMGYLTGWTAKPAIQPWTYAADAKNWSSGLAQDEFLSPDVSVRVSAWTVPTEGATLEDRSQLGTWIATYCQRSGFTPCTGIPVRAVPLCLERRDCHPGMLVRFNEATLAFFTGGIAPDGTVVVAAVWRPESDPIVASFGGAQHLLEAYLSTMSVWPESVPLADRVVRDVPGPTPSPS